MPTPEELVGLLISPNESLAIEYKSWLALSENPEKAKLAKAAIAIANNGGGIIVFGMRPNNSEGGALGSQSRPTELNRYNQDDINAAINRYADPPFHCELLFANHPETVVEHAFVIVPGGIPDVLMSRRSSDGAIAAHRCYMRKPGPRSEEPFTSQEWREVIDRVVRARRDDMLDAIRLIVQGHAGGVPEAIATNELIDFAAEAQERWQALVQGLPPGDVARLPHGHYELAFQIRDVPSASNLADLRRRMESADEIRHTGWTPFVTLGRQPLQPNAVSGTIEAWLGVPEGERTRVPQHCDFWRAHPEGLLFLKRGYDEDGTDRLEPGRYFSLIYPIWRIGETMLYASRLARLFGENPSILVRCRYTGLRGRELATLSSRRTLTPGRLCNDDQATLETLAKATEIDDNLAEVLHPFLAPLYERFALFELPNFVVAEEIEIMRSRRF